MPELRLPRKMPPGEVLERQRRRDIANKALPLFMCLKHVELKLDRRYVVVHWTGSNDSRHSRRWQTRGQDFYPVWYGHTYWGAGGTSTTAMSQLIRWIQQKPVLPLSTWRHWCADGCRLAGDRGAELVSLLAAEQYPTTAECVLCHQPIVGGLDWWSLDGVSGPCCHHTSGCRQKRGAS